MLFTNSVVAGEFNNIIEKIKSEKLPTSAIYEPFLRSEFFALVIITSDTAEVSTNDFKFHIIELKGEPMVIVGESSEVLSSYYVDKKISAIKLTGKQLINTIHPQVGVTMVWERGGFSFPPNLVSDLRNKYN